MMSVGRIGTVGNTHKCVVGYSACSVHGCGCLVRTVDIV
jgi:hypothetical protein